MDRTRWARPPLAIGGLLVAAAAAFGALTTSGTRPSVPATTVHVLGGLAFILVGLHAWSRRPENRLGALMATVGFTWFVRDLRWTGTSAAVTVADLTDTVYLAALGHLALGFPSGRVRARLDRAAVAAAYLWAGLSNVATSLLWAPPESGCSCPRNLLVLHRDAHLHDLLTQAQNLGNIGLVLAVLLLVIRHRVRSTPLGRRALAPVIWASGPVVVAVVALNIVNLVEPLRALSSALPVATPLALMTLPFSILAGQIRSSFARLAVGELVVDLGETPPHHHLREALARTAGDPSLAIAYWVPDSGGYVDGAGRPVELPPEGSGRGLTVLQSGGETVAALIHDASLSENPRLIESVAAVARMAVENERLHARVQAQLADVRASRTRIVEAGDAERRRVERDLHDGAQQRLIGLSLVLGRLRAQVSRLPAADLATTVDEAAEQLRCAQLELRELAAGIHPAVLTEDGLERALETLAERATVPVRISHQVAERLSARVEAAAYFVVSEALANAAKHAAARSVRIEVHRRGDRLEVVVLDDGVGGADAAGSGLRGLADRVAALDGRLLVISPAGRGTRIWVELPCA